VNPLIWFLPNYTRLQQLILTNLCKHARIKKTYVRSQSSFVVVVKAVLIERRLQSPRLCEVGGRGIAMEHWWNDIGRGNGVLGEKTCHSATSSTINLTWTDQGSKPGLRGDRPATDLTRLSFLACE